MLKDNITIVGQCVKDFYCVGTPLQLQVFCTRNKTLVESKAFRYALVVTLKLFLVLTRMPAGKNLGTLVHVFKGRTN